MSIFLIQIASQLKVNDWNNKIFKNVLRQDIAEILLKLTININQSIKNVT